MKPATLPAGIADRRGRRTLFKGEKLEQLLAYLSQDKSTYKGAAKKFKCAKSTVEKTVYRLRKEGHLKDASAAQEKS